MKKQKKTKQTKNCGPPVLSITLPCETSSLPEKHPFPLTNHRTVFNHKPCLFSRI